MRILAIEKDLQPLDPQLHKDLLREEAARVWTLTKEEVIRDIWFTRQNRRAILMLECANEEEARRHLDTLPLVRAGLIDFEIDGLRPYNGFDRLF